jgi:membrane protein YqaA with SNARE-associated domain
MTRFVEWIKGFALAWGGPGLFLIGFLDSSFLSFPEVNDLLIVWMVTQHKERLVYYAFMATAGSVLGCLSLYYVAKKGGEAFLRRRFHERHVDKGLKLFQKYGLFVVIVPALLPPPAPFKIFVLLAGVAAIPVWQFVTAIAVARGIRYGGEGLLAVMYGDRANAFLQDHAREAGLWLSGIAVVIGVIWFLLRQRAERSASGA